MSDTVITAKEQEDAHAQIGVIVSDDRHCRQPGSCRGINGHAEKIKDNGVIVVGHRESSVPFSYYDNQQKVVGYSQDYSNAIVDAIKKKIDAPNLQVKYLPITSSNRIPLLQNGTYDFECGSTTNNLERQKQVDFSDTLFIIGTRLAVKKAAPSKILATWPVRPSSSPPEPPLRCCSTSSTMRSR
ncbi:hypothetical protein SODG_000102 [Sodalis praecaptivus]